MCDSVCPSVGQSVVVLDSYVTPLPNKKTQHSEQHGGGRCQVEGCDKLHQGKQGLENLFFCRAHRKVYRDTFLDGEAGAVASAPGSGVGGQAVLVMLGRRGR